MSKPQSHQQLDLAKPEDIYHGEKSEIRERIQRQTEEYLASGNVINQVPPVTFEFTGISSIRSEWS